MRARVAKLGAVLALGLAAIGLAGCGSNVSGPGFITDQCDVENPPPNCEDDPSTDNVIPAEGRVAEALSGR